MEELRTLAAESPFRVGDGEHHIPAAFRWRWAAYEVSNVAAKVNRASAERTVLHPRSSRSPSGPQDSAGGSEQNFDRDTGQTVSSGNPIANSSDDSVGST